MTSKVADTYFRSFFLFL